MHAAADSSGATGGTRTCIQTHSDNSEYSTKDLQPERIDQILADASLVYFDGRLTQAATQLAKAARSRGIPVLVEAERLRPGLEALLQEADYICTSAHFPKVTLASKILSRACKLSVVLDTQEHNHTDTTT